jgi:hypothetical protein
MPQHPVSARICTCGRAALGALYVLGALVASPTLPAADLRGGGDSIPTDSLSLNVQKAPAKSHSVVSPRDAATGQAGAAAAATGSTSRTMLPAVQAAREASARSSTSANKLTVTKPVDSASPTLSK